MFGSTRLMKKSSLRCPGPSRWITDRNLARTPDRRDLRHQQSRHKAWGALCRVWNFCSGCSATTRPTARTRPMVSVGRRFPHSLCICPPSKLFPVIAQLRWFGYCGDQRAANIGWRCLLHYSRLRANYTGLTTTDVATARHVANSPQQPVC